MKRREREETRRTEREIQPERAIQRERECKIDHDNFGKKKMAKVSHSTSYIRESCSVKKTTSQNVWPRINLN